MSEDEGCSAEQVEEDWGCNLPQYPTAYSFWDEQLPAGLKVPRDAHHP